MTNYNERLDDVLAKHGAEPGEFTHSLKQAITSLFKELVAEAKPVRKMPESGDSVAVYYEKMLTEFEQNLLKALEEKK